MHLHLTPNNTKKKFFFTACLLSIFQVIVDQVGIWFKIYQVFVFLPLNSWDLIVNSPLSSCYIFLCKLVDQDNNAYLISLIILVTCLLVNHIWQLKGDTQTVMSCMLIFYNWSHSFNTEMEYFIEMLSQKIFWLR